MTDQAPDSLEAIRDSITWKGLAVGPTAPPYPFDGVSFSSTIGSYITQSRSLSWIKDQPTADRYAALVDSLKAQLLRSDSASALVTLDSVMQQSVRDSSSSLTSEAFALVFFNAQYLAGQLPAPSNSFTITASHGPNGSISPPGNNVVNYGDSLRFTITPDPGYHVSDVYIDSLTSVGPVTSYTFPNVTANHTIDAFFAINQYTIVAWADTVHGVIDPKGNNTVNYGDSIRFTITPHTGYHVSEVYINNGDSLIGAPASYTFRNVTADNTINAYFTINQYTLVTTAVHGSVTKNPNQPLYDSNTVIQLTAIPDTGYHFVNWSGDASGSTDTVHVTMNADKNITASFAINTYTITPTAGPNGSITPDSNVVIHYGDSAHFAITPNSCYHVDSVIVDGTRTDSTRSYTFRNLTASHTIRGVFRLNADTVTASAGSNGSINPSGIVPVNCGSSQRFTFIQSTGYHVDSVIVDGAKTDSTTSYTFTNVTTNHRVRGVFAIDRYLLTVNSNPPAGGTTTPSGGQYDSNTVVQLRGTPNSGYRFDHWSGDASGPADTTSVTMNAAKTVTANFVRTLQVIIGTDPVGRSFTVDSSPYTSTQTFTWDSAASHTIATTSPQSGGTGKQFAWTNWSDAGAISHVIAPTTSGTYTANFKTQFQLTVSSSPDTNAGTTNPRGSNWYDSSTVVSDTAAPKSCRHFAGWTGDFPSGHGTDNPLSVTMNMNKTITANFAISLDTIVASAGTGGSINPTGTVLVNCGSNQTFNIGANTCYHIDSVIVDGTNQGAISSYTFTNVTANHSIRAAFRINQDTIAASQGSGGSISPTGTVFVNCGSNQTFNINGNTCYHIDSVIVDGTNQGAILSYTFTNVTANHSIRAAFRINQDTITALAGGGGSINPNGTVLVNCGSNQTFNISASTCYHIDSVLVDGTNQGAVSSYTFTNVTANHSIRAAFRINQETIAASAGSGGSISPSGNVAVNCGSNQTFNINGNTCYHIDSVIVDGTNQGAISSYTFTNVTANHTIRAAFKINQYTIVPSAGSGGTINPSGSTPVNCGSNQTFTITPGTCYHIDSVIVDGVKSDSTTSYTFTNVTANHTIRAAFKINQYTIVPSAGSGGTINPSGSTPVNCGANQTFTITPNSCYHVDSVIVDGVKTDSTASYTFTNVTANHTIRAAFKINQYTIVPSGGSGGTINPSGSTPVNCGANQTFTITPNSCYHIDSVIVDGAKNDSTTSYTFTNVTANHSIRAVFAVNKDTIVASVDVENPWGTISPSGTVVHTCGANQTFTITPNACYGVSQVLVDGVNMGSITTYTFTNIGSNHTIVASFSRLSYSINAGAKPGGSISPSGNVGVSCGTNQAFTITPNTGFNINSVVVDGVSQGAISTYTFHNVTSNHTISATFICIGYTITASAGAGGTVSPSGNVNVCSGSSQTFTITANSGYTISNVVVDGVSKGAISTYTFPNVTSNHTISASFSGGGSCQPPCCIYNDASYDKLTVTDAKGVQKTLLVRNALRPIAAGITDNSIASQLSLGTLNASFQSGQTVQSVSPDQGSMTFSIVVSGATYPLTLTLTTNAQNKIQYWLVRSGQSNLQLTTSSSVQIGSSTNGIINIQPLATQPCQ